MPAAVKTAVTRRVRDRVGRVIFGQKEVIDQTLITLLAGGHALLVERLNAALLRAKDAAWAVRNDRLRNAVQSLNCPAGATTSSSCWSSPLSPLSPTRPCRTAG